jgi:predicted RNase H-like nuclease (RuvC/YqgF family)
MSERPMDESEQAELDRLRGEIERLRRLNRSLRADNRRQLATIEAYRNEVAELEKHGPHDED